MKTNLLGDFMGWCVWLGGWVYVCRCVCALAQFSKPIKASSKQNFICFQSKLNTTDQSINQPLEEWQTNDDGDDNNADDNQHSIYSIIHLIQFFFIYFHEIGKTNHMLLENIRILSSALPVITQQNIIFRMNFEQISHQ